MEIMTETRGEKLIVNEQGEVVGVEATQSTGTSVLIHAEAVILASGGYDRNPELKKNIRRPMRIPLPMSAQAMKATAC